MYILPAHPSQSKALDNTGKNTLNVIESKHLNAQYRFIQNELTKNLELGKTNLFIVPDRISPDFAPKLLANFKLAKLSLIINEKSPLSEKQLAQIKALNKSEKKRYNPKNYEVSKTNVFKQQQKLKLSYSLLNRPIFGNRSWSYIATNNNYYSLHEEVSLLRQKLKDQQFQFNQSEYWLMRGRIEEAMKLYNPQFNFIENADCFQIGELANSGIDNVIVKLTSFSKRCQKLNYHFSRFIEDYSRHFYNQGLQEIENINIHLEQLIVKINEYEVRYGRTFDNQIGLQEKLKQRFSTSFKEQVSARMELRELTLNLVTTFKDSQKYNLDISSVLLEDIQLSYIKEVISKASHKIDHWRNAVTKYKNHSLKQVNLLNSNRVELIEMDEEFQRLIEDINRSKIFTDRFEDNTFNILKKIEFVSEVKEKVNQAHWLISNHSDYIHWRIVSENYPPEVIRFIDGLKNFNTNRWIVLFDRFYIEEITKQNFHPNIPSNFSTLDRFIEHSKNYREDVVHWINHAWEKKRLRASEQLQSKDRKLHAQLFKKSKNCNETLFKILKNHADFLRIYYPVIVINESLVKELNNKLKKDWDVVWVMTEKDSKSVDPHLIQQLGNKFIYLKNDPFEKKELKSIQFLNKQNSVKPNFLPVDYKELITPFKLLHKSEILSTAKKISSKLSFVQKKQRIFQLKDKSIISYLTNQNNEKLIKLLDNHGIKELIHKSKNDLDLVDVLVNIDNEIVLITQDGLFDSENIESAEWQYNQLRQLQNLGIHWVNIWTSSYYYEEGDVLQKALMKIINQDKTVSNKIAKVK